MSETRAGAVAVNLWIATGRRIVPGLAFALAVAAAGYLSAKYVVGATTINALLIGMALHPLARGAAFKEGLAVAGRQVLRVGVALVGVRITFGQILDLGPTPLLLACVAVGASVLFARALGGRLGMAPDTALICGGSVGVCGVSAAMALAAALPAGPSRERDVAATIGTLTLLSTMAMLLYPLLAAGLGFNSETAGMFIGATVHDVAQVAGAGYAISNQVGDVAVFTKLLRVAMLIPLVFILLWGVVPAGGRGKAPPIPVFVLAFACVVAVNSFGLIPGGLQPALAETSRWLLLTAVASIGLQLSLKDLGAVGWRLPALMTGATLLQLGLILGLLLALGPGP